MCMLQYKIVFQGKNDGRKSEEGFGDRLSSYFFHLPLLIAAGTGAH
jgi:hypothetical protein